MGFILSCHFLISKVVSFPVLVFLRRVREMRLQLYCRLDRKLKNFRCRTILMPVGILYNSTENVAYIIIQGIKHGNFPARSVTKFGSY